MRMIDPAAEREGERTGEEIRVFFREIHDDIDLLCPVHLGHVIGSSYRGSSRLSTLRPTEMTRARRRLWNFADRTHDALGRPIVLFMLISSDTFSVLASTSLVILLVFPIFLLFFSLLFFCFLSFPAARYTSSNVRCQLNTRRHWVDAIFWEIPVTQTLIKLITKVPSGNG